MSKKKWWGIFVILSLCMGGLICFHACSGDDDDSAEGEGEDDDDNDTDDDDGEGESEADPDKVSGYVCTGENPLGDSCIMELGGCYQPEGDCTLTEDKDNNIFTIEWSNGASTETTMDAQNYSSTSVAKMNGKVCYTAETEVDTDTAEYKSTIKYGNKTFIYESNEAGDVKITCPDGSIEEYSNEELDAEGCKSDYEVAKTECTVK